jgi:phage shock protein PspC (stress-responsive transcriptional regulator)
MEQTDSPTSPPPSPARKLTRSRSDRVIGGVCGGLAEYLGVDVLIVRIVAVASVFLAGLGALLYLGALLLLPDAEGETIADTTTTRGRLLTAVGVVALVLAAAVLLSGAVVGSLAVLVPVACLALLGLAVSWLASGEGLTGGWTQIAQRSLLGLAVLALCTALFAAGGWAGAVGGETVVAAVIIAAGAALAVGAFVRPVRWLILPAVSLGLGTGFVAAAGIDFDGGVGEREYRPVAAADVRDRYELGMGSLVVDLRGTRLPKGDVPVEFDVGMGEARLVVPEDVCVASRATIGMGAVENFGHETGGVDVDVEDLPTATPATTRLVVDADVGLGVFEVSHTAEREHGRRFGRERFGDDAPSGRGNLACESRRDAG